MSDEFHPGRKLGAGRYVLERELGRGGMGVVWLAGDTELGEPVALKFIPSEIRNDAMALDDMRRETLKSRRLTHPHIARIHDFCNFEGEPPFITMEFMDGPNLSALQVEQPGRVFDWETVLPWLKQLCSALQYAHEENVVHRDIKPGNLMLDSRGRIKLCDFGLAATIADSMSRATRDMGSSGTPPYMSPQQLDGGAPSPADDVYSLGATLYELFTGKPPFHSGDIPHQIRSIAPTTIPDKLAELDVVNPLPEAAMALVMQCLVKNPVHRPAGAAAIAECAAAIDVGATKTAEAPASESDTFQDVEVPAATELSEPEPSEPPADLRKRAANKKIAIIAVCLAVLLGGLKKLKERGPAAAAGPAPAAATVPSGVIVPLVEGTHLRNCRVLYLRKPEAGDLTLEEEAWSPGETPWTINADKVITASINGEAGVAHKSYLVFESEDLADFELAFAYEFHSTGRDASQVNAGVFYRSHPTAGWHARGFSPILLETPPGVWPKDATRPAGAPTQDVDFWETIDPDLEAAIQKTELYQSGNWCVIKARGNRIHHFVNGVCVNREIVTDASQPHSGKIAIEIWSSGDWENLVEFEGFFLKRLD